MPLQIRRGTAAERSAISSPLVIGELLYVTDQGKLYIGDGTALGGPDALGNPGQGGKGLVITGFTSEESQDATALLFDNGTHSNIFFTYDDANNALSLGVDLSSYTGNISLVGNLDIDGILEASAFKGSIFADDSTLLVDAVSGTIPYSILSGSPTALSQFTNDVNYVRLADIIDGTLSIDVNNTGDLQGSVYGEDSSLLVDSINSRIVGFIDIRGNEIFDDVGDTGLNIRSNQTDRNVYIYSYGSDGSGTGAGNIYVKSNAIEIYSDWQDGGVGEQKWTFANDGGFQFPDGTIQTTAWTGSAVGSFIGDLQGSVFGDNSTLLIDGISNRLVGDLYGTVRSNIEIVRGVNTFQEVLLSQIDNTNLSNYMTFSKARGSIGSPAAVQQNDAIYDVQWVGHDGSNFQTTARLRATVGGTVSSGVVPGNLDLSIADNSGNLNNVLNITSSGLFNFNGLGLLINSDDEEDSPVVCRSHFDTNVNAPNFSLQRTRGTASSPTAVQVSDKIFDLSWEGYSPSGGFNVSTRIRSTVYAAPSGSTVPGQMEFATRKTSGALTTEMIIDEHKITMSVMPILPTYAGDVAAAAACGGTPVNGMMYYDSNTSTIRVFVGSAWASL
jgi:hypothetical protein